MSESALLIIFAKAPVEGTVNTRLVPEIGVTAATELQRNLIVYCMREYCGRDDFDVQLWCAPDTRHEFFQHCAYEYNIALYQQQGNDLGARMSHAFSVGLKNYDRVVLIGTDAPALNAAIVKQAIGALDSNDVVIVPAEDGGYVMIAMRDYYDNVFTSVSWGSPQVLSKTRDNVRQSGLHYKELDTCWDIDRLEDYQRYLDMKRT